MSAKFYNSSRKLYEGVELNTVLNDDELNVEAAKAQRKALDGQIEVNLAEELRDFKKNGGKSWFAPYLKLKFGPGKITPNEYFYYQLHSRNDAEAMRYAGKRLQRQIHLKCVELSGLDLAENKLVHQILCSNYQIPVPEISAIYQPEGNPNFNNLLSSTEQVKEFLSNQNNYPLFIKPIDGMYSIGAIWLDSISEQIIFCKNGKKYSVDQLAAFIASMNKKGYLMQKPIQPNGITAEAIGDRLLSVRFLVLRTTVGPKVEIATCKIPVGNHDTDNFWHEGNLLGAVKLDTGQIYRVVQGTGSRSQLLQNHPDTNATLTEFALPHWNELKNLAINASRIFDGMKTQSWDICISKNGPVVLEMNCGGDLNLHQLAHGKGILTEQYIAHLRNCGFTGKLP